MSKHDITKYPALSMKVLSDAYIHGDLDVIIKLAEAGYKLDDTLEELMIDPSVKLSVGQIMGIAIERCSVVRATRFNQVHILEHIFETRDIDILTIRCALLAGIDYDAKEAIAYLLSKMDDDIGTIKTFTIIATEKLDILPYFLKKGGSLRGDYKINYSENNELAKHEISHYIN